MHPAPSEESIRRRAYFLWEADGRPEGRDEHYWHLASSQLGHEIAAPAPSVSVAPTSTPRRKTQKTAVKDPKTRSAGKPGRSAPAAK
ncbi:DUF2934 domain-containing protein [Paraburkholderia sp. MPAMCS5]|uniref:DUF2934 domain-containing protein n=1 Tax=Paraburkholderia sp. MPAMCS5 TaxID=3112563 RepID=UPI002E191402|nr:DUF2934 domain-containing protein [Paraburkholderia sp. MPAMCS5]